MNRSGSTALAAGAGVAAAGAGFVYVRPRLLVWGALPQEIGAPMAGDEVVPLARYRSTHGISIAATATEVWPWLAQLGQGRGGLYSYDRLENLFGCGIHSASSVVPEWQDLGVGDDVRLVPADHPAPLRFQVALAEPPRRLLLVAPGTPDDAFRAGLPYVSWSFQVNDHLRGCSRLVVRLRSDFRPTPTGLLANKYMLEPVHWLMERKMLLGIKRRAEQRVERRSTGRAAEPAAKGSSAVA
ncbi:MAG TPA: hypothetical protein VLR26_16440 [Frankiaceae bacterium]|nr:hypothetical protein [Frankiaceae bacterium]